MAPCVPGSAERGSLTQEQHDSSRAEPAALGGSWLGISTCLTVVCQGLKGAAGKLGGTLCQGV